MAIRLPCYCATLRQATRVLSQKYDAALHGVDLTITQFTLLMALDEMTRPRVNDLADALAMDQTTLSRTLKIMERDGLVDSVSGEDKRESRWAMTNSGRERFRRGLPRWKVAQKELEKFLGVAGVESLTSTAFDIAARLVP